ncbi:hypothetical protein QFZ81_004035 [Paenibacillus sp. V4I9]|uniref:hypothetical protein n=1 Tax=Paenibacillus sp. V4I9 TaxID=3042308 RepID=UPI002784A497|nr:hypothetical protein [Paenibacillus sp. V4I9]MDQ0888947.1 hypothetical protein [Paenibacillus sp. V4I9]
MVDVIERKIQFTKTNTIFDKTDFYNNDEGELQAYNEMLMDINEMKEIEFVNKYLDIIMKISIKFEENEITDGNEIEKLSGYNNAVVSILKCINPIYEYEIKD